MSKKQQQQVTWTVTLHAASGDREWTYEIAADARTGESEVARAAWLWHDREGGDPVDPRRTKAKRA
ncbi:MAG TPA: hypothetical protein VE172_01445 [Stackebrandtia sp.]|uniref:hypothetical protein n=1 Tax=Stackebrandtia sp. TaxID=2023065 RepID=UPI002D2BE1D1|nr:hypothetical protein [Stackebrandtia sp.]HZE37452.1 hypothetical protein [Stackebrandtia sp.]